MMRKLFLCAFLCGMSAVSAAQSPKPFDGYFYNEEFQTWLDIDFYGQKVKVPGQEIFGDVAGYMGARRDTRKWIVATIKLLNDTTATAEITNDYGSEDLQAIFSYKKAANAIVLKQGKGSNMKIVVNRKWVKLPKEITFSRQKNPFRP